MEGLVIARSQPQVSDLRSVHGDTLLPERFASQQESARLWRLDPAECQTAV